MSEEDENGEKSHEPTQKKLDDARKKGNIAKSDDLNTAAAYLGLILAVAIAGANSINMAGTGMSVFLRAPEDLFGHLNSPTGNGALGQAVWPILSALAVFFAVPAVLVLGSLFAQQAFVFAPSKIEPKLSKISPLATMKKKFGPTGLFQFAKSTVKLIVVGLVMTWFLISTIEELISTARLEEAQVSLYVSKALTDFMVVIFILSLAIGGGDYLWQVFDLNRQNRMSRKDMEDEHKDSEGDPHIKQKRRQKAQEIALNSMLADVPKADVVMVNPTHYAVALQWSTDSRSAPIVLAKGKDEIAARIRELADKHQVPIYRDPPATRAIFSAVKIGDPILPESYAAVAVAIRFAIDLRDRRRRR